MSLLALAGTSRVWPALAASAAAIVLLVGVVWLSYDHGQSVEKAEWQAKWNKRDSDDLQAAKDASEAERSLEQAHQKAIDQVQADAEKQIDTALTHAADASLAADWLRGQVAKLLAADRARRDSCAPSSSQAAENPGNLLAVVLDKSVQRNRELAALADSARIAGLACEAAYKAISD